MKIENLTCPHPGPFPSDPPTLRFGAARLPRCNEVKAGARRVGEEESSSVMAKGECR